MGTDTGAVLQGEIQISGVACENNVDGTKTYIPIKTQQSFEQNVNLDCHLDDKSVLECKIFSPFCEALFDADNIHLKVQLCGKVLLERAEDCERLSECHKGAEATSAASTSRITVYYPIEGDTLFSVAKKFHTTVAKLALDNGIDESVMKNTDGSFALADSRIIIR